VVEGEPSIAQMHHPRQQQRQGTDGRTPGWPRCVGRRTQSPKETIFRIIGAYDSSGNPVTLTGGTGGGPVGYVLGLSAPAGGVTFGPNGDLYIPDPYNGVDQYAANGTYIRSFGYADPLDGPSGVAIDASGNVFVTDVTNGNVVEFDSNGNYLATLDPSNPVVGGNGWAQPTALTFEPDGNLLISDDFGITQYDFSSVTAFSTGGGDFLAYDATVPEPSMVLLCALGGLALLVRRSLLLR
jgi:hypothetical protein